MYTFNILANNKPLAWVDHSIDFSSGHLVEWRLPRFHSLPRLLCSPWPAKLLPPAISAPSQNNHFFIIK
jgi:hypothetical protein